ncbi:MAG TPA: cyclic nucleotide-binding domain-containing protein [Terriglobales bacterium]|nr:cyclic nucleotide-binding domain-containing protein [Terriglobales bacterium]
MESANHPSCLGCELRPRVFCDLPPQALRLFDQIKSISEYARGATLFREGHPTRGIYILCRGRVRLSVSSDHGRRLLLRIAHPGEILGMSACLSGSSYELTAEALDPLQVAFIRRKELLAFLRAHREACMQVINLLSQDLHSAYERVRTLGWSRSRACTPSQSTRVQ